MSLADRIEAMEPDAQRVVMRIVERVVSRLELGRAQYGDLNLATDPRDWRAEAAEEAVDGLVYTAAGEIALDDCQGWSSTPRTVRR